MRFILKLSILSLAALTLPESFSFAGVFDSKIQYFDNGVDVVPDPKPKASGKKDEPKKAFEWKAYLDPEKDEFFREGDYIPPAPFMEAIRRPTKENILLFEKWQEEKNELLSKYELARAKYLGNSYQPVKATTPVTDTSAVSDISKFRFVFYFEVSCSACQAMFSTINEMIDRGIYVEAVRVDKGEGEVRGLKIPWTPASQAETKATGIHALPFLTAFDDKSKKVYRLAGRKTIRKSLIS